MSNNLGASFALGPFFWRFLDSRIESWPPEGRCLVDPWWDDEPALRYRNLADRLEPYLDIHHVHLASWFLARLWYLSAGTIEPALNVQAGHGVADGGHYLAYAVVENA